jgi:hypothetical protein
MILHIRDREVLVIDIFKAFSIIEQHYVDNGIDYSPNDLMDDLFEYQNKIWKLSADESVVLVCKNERE